MGRRGLDQQGFCFVAPDSPSGVFKLVYQGNMVYAETRPSKKVPENTIIVDLRLSDSLQLDDGGDVLVEPVPGEIPTCTEIRLSVGSIKGLNSEKVAKAMEKRIDDFQKYLDDLILYAGQALTISELGVQLHILSVGPEHSSTKSARISWKNLLKINLVPAETQFCNLCIIAEVAAATQIADVVYDREMVSRHQAILSALQRIEDDFNGFSHDAVFSGIAFSDDISQFKTFDPQTGSEIEITSLHSPSLIRAFREWFDGLIGENLKLPSNPGKALSVGLERARSLSESNNLPTVVLFFSSGIYSTGQNPVKISRTQGSTVDVMILALSVGVDSVLDIMEAIAKEGNGVFIHLDNIEKTASIVPSIDRMLLDRR